MIDIVQLLLKAGSGGNGWVSFRREKFVTKGGPDGGDGGDGGNVIIRATRNQATLAHFAGVKEVVANKGQTGGKKKMFGRSAEDQVIEVPLGTVVWQVDSRHIVGNNRKRKYYLEKETDPIPPRPDLAPEIEVPRLDPHQFSRRKPGVGKILLKRFTEEGQELVVCRGGRGGRGNTAFKSSMKTTPLEAEYGGLGQERLVVLELELLADVGLVGLPNAGKSTFLSRVTKAQPKIANYPFTTLAPHLGVWQLSPATNSSNSANSEDDSSRGPSAVVVADIPGLIEGASEGKGLGHDFLRHVKNCRVLLFVVYLPESVVFDQTVTDQEKAEQVWQQYQLLDAELRAYSEQLTDKPRLVALNKIDMYPESLQHAIQKTLATQFKKSKQPIPVLKMSGATNEGLAQLAAQVQEIVKD